VLPSAQQVSPADRLRRRLTFNVRQLNGRAMRPIFIVFAVLLAGCSRYDAEVGYYEGTAERWDVWGVFSSLDECRDAAISRYNYYNQERQGRAFSWACLKKNHNGGYESRHR